MSNLHHQNDLYRLNSNQGISSKPYQYLLLSNSNAHITTQITFLGHKFYIYIFLNILLFSMMGVIRNESGQLSFFVMETAKIQVRH